LRIRLRRRHHRYRGRCVVEGRAAVRKGCRVVDQGAPSKSGLIRLKALLAIYDPTGSWCRFRPHTDLTGNISNMPLPDPLHVGLKEWAAVCRALEEGRQMLLLRKG